MIGRRKLITLLGGAAAGQADRSVCAGHIHPGGGTGGCVAA